MLEKQVSPFQKTSSYSPTLTKLTEERNLPFPVLPGDVPGGAENIHLLKGISLNSQSQADWFRLTYLSSKCKSKNSIFNLDQQNRFLLASMKTKLDDLWFFFPFNVKKKKWHFWRISALISIHCKFVEFFSCIQFNL